MIHEVSIEEINEKNYFNTLINQSERSISNPSLALFFSPTSVTSKPRTHFP